MKTSAAVCLLLSAILVTSTSGHGSSRKRYTPDWDSLDSRPLPTWYDDAKFGVFLHWGVYSVPAWGGEWFWAQWASGDKYITEHVKKIYPPNLTYQDFAAQFKAELFNAEDFVGTIAASGAQYLILTTKHHEGYTLFASNYSFGWNAKDVGPGKDLVRLIRDEVKNGQNKMKFGAYYSLYEWFNPLYRRDSKNKFQTQDFVNQKMIPEMKQLVNEYEPDLIWVDGDWEANDTYFRSREFLAWLYNDSPVRDTVVVNDRWGKGIPCHHGDFYTCKDNFLPGHLIKHKFESARTVDKYSWGYRRDMSITDTRSTKEIIENLAQVVSCGGNMALNVGPDPHGKIPNIFVERLWDVGKWLRLNGKAIYATRPWDVARNDSVTGDLWYTTKGDTLYAIVLTYPVDHIVHLGCVPYHPGLNVKLLGYDGLLPINIGPSGELLVELPNRLLVQNDWAWVLEILMPNNTQCLI